MQSYVDTLNISFDFYFNYIIHNNDEIAIAKTGSDATSEDIVYKKKIKTRILQSHNKPSPKGLSRPQEVATHRLKNNAPRNRRKEYWRFIQKKIVSYLIASDDQL